MFDFLNDGFLFFLLPSFSLSFFLVIPVIGGVSFAKDEKIVATYMMNGKKTITESEIISHYKKRFVAKFPEEDNQSQRSFFDLSVKEKQRLIKDYLVTKLIDQEVAEKLKILKSQKLQEKIKMEKRELIHLALLRQKIHITDEMVNDQYQRIVDMYQGQEEVKIAHILVDDKDQAVQIKRRLSKGAKFYDLAKEFSKDESTKYKGGEIANYIDPRNVQPKEYGDKVFSMKKNEISDPIEINNGWYIIKVLDRRAVVIPLKEQVEQSIRVHLFINAYRQYAKDLLNKVNLEIK